MSGPDLMFVIVRHADDCPILLPVPGSCTCKNPRLQQVGFDEFARQFIADRHRRASAALAEAEVQQ